MLNCIEKAEKIFQLPHAEINDENFSIMIIPLMNKNSCRNKFTLQKKRWWDSKLFYNLLFSCSFVIILFLNLCKFIIFFIIKVHKKNRTQNKKI